MMTLKSWREANGYSQARLAQEAGVHETTLSRIERGLSVPRRALAQRLTKITGLPLSAVMCGVAA